MDAEHLLRKLGVTGNLKGFRYAAYMIGLAEENPDAVISLSKSLYAETAERFHVTSASVERNLRTIVQICWTRGNREFLNEIAETNLTIQPTNGMFLDMAAGFLRRKRNS